MAWQFRPPIMPETNGEYASGFPPRFFCDRTKRNTEAWSCSVDIASLSASGGLSPTRKKANPRDLIRHKLQVAQE
jgi:hypothetical protein